MEISQELSMGNISLFFLRGDGAGSWTQSLRFTRHVLCYLIHSAKRKPDCLFECLLLEIFVNIHPWYSSCARCFEKPWRKQNLTFITVLNYSFLWEKKSLLKVFWDLE
jgi:hypothetical protein